MFSKYTVYLKYVRQLCQCYIQNTDKYMISNASSTMTVKSGRCKMQRIFVRTWQGTIDVIARQHQLRYIIIKTSHSSHLGDPIKPVLLQKQTGISFLRFVFLPFSFVLFNLYSNPSTSIRLLRCANGSNYWQIVCCDVPALQAKAEDKIL